MNKSEEFIRQLLMDLPCLRELGEEHMACYEGILPHVFMGDLSRFIIGEALREPNSPAQRGILDALELAMVSGVEELSELICVSFVENLVGESQAVESMLPMMGPKLRGHLRTVQGSCD